MTFLNEWHLGNPFIKKREEVYFADTTEEQFMKFLLQYYDSYSWFTANPFTVWAKVVISDSRVFGEGMYVIIQVRNDLGCVSVYEGLPEYYKKFDEITGVTHKKYPIRTITDERRARELYVKITSEINQLSLEEVLGGMDYMRIKEGRY